MEVVNSSDQPLVIGDHNVLEAPDTPQTLHAFIADGAFVEGMRVLLDFVVGSVCLYEGFLLVLRFCIGCKGLLESGFILHERPPWKNVRHPCLLCRGMKTRGSISCFTSPIRPKAARHPISSITAPQHPVQTNAKTPKPNNIHSRAQRKTNKHLPCKTTAKRSPKVTLNPKP